MTKRYVNQWGIYIVNLGETYGSIQKETRPVVIMQNCIGNQFSPTTICVPLTTQYKKDLPTHCKLHKKDYPFLEDSTVLCEQVTTIDIEKQLCQYLGMVNKEDRTRIYNTFLKNFIL